MNIKKKMLVIALLTLPPFAFGFEEIGYKIGAGLHDGGTLEDSKAFEVGADMFWSVDPHRRFAFGVESGLIAHNHFEGDFDKLYYGEFIARFSPLRSNFRYTKNIDLKAGFGYYNGSRVGDIKIYGFGMKVATEISLNNKYSLGIEYRSIPLEQSEGGNYVHQSLMLLLHITPDRFWHSQNTWYNF